MGIKYTIDDPIEIKRVSLNNITPHSVLFSLMVSIGIIT
jgi:hypothetical protein